MRCFHARPFLSGWGYRDPRKCSLFWVEDSTIVSFQMTSGQQIAIVFIDSTTYLWILFALILSKIQLSCYRIRPTICQLIQVKHNMLIKRGLLLPLSNLTERPHQSNRKTWLRINGKVTLSHWNTREFGSRAAAAAVFILLPQYKKVILFWI